MKDEDWEALASGLSSLREIEQAIDDLDYDNDPDAEEKYLGLTDMLLTGSMLMGPIRKKSGNLSRTRNQFSGSRSTGIRF